uniref:Nuclear pore complex protein n=1 Tax=Daphnia similis TaxID=35528 RepID=A0A4Y7LRH9_9CRUS|nr:EOG090X01MR [Daphnia similis]
MEFQSPIISGSDLSVTDRLNLPSRRMKLSLEKSSNMMGAVSLASPNRHTMSLMSDDLSRTIFEGDPTFTRIGLAVQRKTLDETRVDLTLNNMSRKKHNEELMSILLEEEVPGVENVLELFESFLQTFQSYGAEHQVFNQCAEYESKCGEQVTALHKLIQMAPQGHKKLAQAQELEQELRFERDTWRLVASLYQDRLNSELQDSEMESEEIWSGLDDATSEDDLVRQLYDKNAIIRQAQLVVDWLEQRAADVYHDSHYSQAEFYGDAVTGWENTLHSLISKKRGISTDNAEQNLVTQMDPDAPNREQSRRLHPLDKEDEMRLLRSVFARLRCGQMDEAQQLCFRAGQPFRAAILEGWKLFHDPNMKSRTDVANTKESPSGNPYRDIWKTMSWKECENVQLSEEERSILALLCGHLKALLPACPSWEDQLWAHLRAMIDHCVEKELRRCVNYKRQLQVLPDEYWNQQLTVESIFSTLAASREKTLVAEGRDQYRIIQRYLIMDDVDGLLEEMSSWLSKGDSWSVHLRPHMLRLMAHLSLFFRRIGRGSSDDLIGSILEAYVLQLVNLGRTDLAAVYVAQLPLPEDQIRLYAQCLVMVEDQQESCEDTERQRLLYLAHQVGLDVNAIAKQVVITLCNQGDNIQHTSDASLQVATSAEDERRIRSLSWLLMDPSMRSQLLIQANTLMRGYLLRRQIEAVKLTFKLIPPDTLKILSELWESRTGLTDLPTEVAAATREYLSIQAYIDALDAFQEWFTRFHHSKPKKTEASVQQQRGGASAQLSFTENLLKEQHLKQHQVEMLRWQAAVDSLTETAIDKLYNVLLFPDGGWMGDSVQFEDEDTPRQQQQQLLRQSCIPHAALLLCNVLTSTHRHSQCLELANVVASEQQSLYKVCSAEQLAQLTKQLRQAYVKLLDLGESP